MLWWAFGCSIMVFSSVTEYACEVGAQVGMGYYVGDATKTIFTNPREAYGAQFRYKFDLRWAMQLKVQRQRIAFSYTPLVAEDISSQGAVNFQNPMWSADVTAEYNFFRFGLHPHDLRVKPITPFVSLGVGVTACNKLATMMDLSTDKYPRLTSSGFESLMMYIPVGIGVKWKITERWQLQACWQHQIYMADNIEGYMSGYDAEDAIKAGGESILNNSHNLNGYSIFNNDLTSTLTVGVVFEFGKRGRMCYFCED